MNAVLGALYDSTDEGCMRSDMRQSKTSLSGIPTSSPRNP
jgi:hypothetical protein